MADDLDLSALASGPAPVLAAAADVRARGDQRTRRTRTFVAGAAALVVLATAGTAVALAGGGKPDALQIATTPTPTSGDDGLYGVLGMTARTLLGGSDVEQATGSAWRGVGGRGAPSLMVCGSGAPAEVAPVSSLATSFTTGSGSEHVSSQVSLYDTADHARAASAAVGRDLARCPRRPDDSEDGKAFSTFSALPLTGAVGLVQTYRDCETCAPLVTYWGVVTEDRWTAEVSTTRQRDLQALVDAQRALLAGCPSVQQCADTRPGDAFPGASDPHVGDRLWADYLQVDDPSDPTKLASAMQLAFQVGYAATETVLGCDQGAPLEGRATSTRAVALYFETQAAAQRFAQTWTEATDALPLTPVQVTVLCLG